MIRSRSYLIFTRFTVGYISCSSDDGSSTLIGAAPTGVCDPCLLCLLETMLDLLMVEKISEVLPMQRVSGFASGFGACLLFNSNNALHGAPRDATSRAEPKLRSEMAGGDFSFWNKASNSTGKEWNRNQRKGVVALQTANWEVVELYNRRLVFSNSGLDPTDIFCCLSICRMPLHLPLWSCDRIHRLLQRIYFHVFGIFKGEDLHNCLFVAPSAYTGDFEQTWVIYKTEG